MLWGLLVDKHQVEHVKTLEEILAESHEQEQSTWTMSVLADYYRD
jgi:hypothetical protein